MKKVGEVFETMDYSLFKTLEGNRNVNPLHVKRLVDSYKKGVLNTSIMVNKMFQVIDGQHTLEARKQLGLPIRFTIESNYGLNEVQLLNTTVRKWTSMDYLDGYCNLGNVNYIKLRNFINEYKLPSTTSAVILSGDKGGAAKAIRDGVFTVKDENKAHILAKNIIKCSKFHDAAKQKSFVYAFMSACNNKRFIPDVFLRKLEIKRQEFYHCAKASQYLRQIEDTYNYRLQSSGRITLK